MAKKILVIDDEPLILKTVGKLLEIEGYFVTASESGKEALSIIDKEEIDLVISDIRMPGMDGVETICLINDYFKGSTKSAPPFIFITGYADETMNEAALKLEPSDLLYKPFDKDKFLASVKLALGI